MLCYKCALMPAQPKPWKTSRHTFPKSRKPSCRLNEGADIVGAERKTKLGGFMQKTIATEGRAPEIARAANSLFVGRVISKDGTAIVSIKLVTDRL